MELNYKWNLKDSIFKKDKGKVFSCFACGGGSTMGYKLAGFDVIGANDIDPKMMQVYNENHKPNIYYLESISTLCKRNDIDKSLYNLDILDGSPPCSSFSTGGNRSKDWGKKKKFKEGQSEQILDTLFFDFINLAKKLQPKVVVAENVEGLLLGKAKEYVRNIYKSFDDAGYYCNHFLLDSSKMGVPQERKRVFFICLRKDLAKPFLKQIDMFTQVPEIVLNFNDKPINFGEIQLDDVERDNISESYIKYWEKANYRGVYDERQSGGIKFGYFRKAMKNRPLATVMAGNVFAIEESPKKLVKDEFCMVQSYPLDYDFLDINPQYLIGMSVPPIMIAKIANEIYSQWLVKI